jgi:hemerythrin-like domain-containing protein
MSDAIRLLYLEHRSIARVLDVVESQLGLLERGHEPDEILLQLAVDYFAGYSDECHHPKEDLLFRKLRARAPDAADGLADLLQEHRELRKVSLELSRQVDRLRSGTLEGNGELCNALRRFLRANRGHMAAEERNFFPAVTRTLTPEDLAEIEFQVLDRPDPLVDQATETRFKRLRDEIDRRAEANVRAAQRTAVQWRDESATLLRGPTDVTRFNAIWSGRGARLVRIATGGYSLERDGAQIVFVPECSEERAVWCALFYLKGERAGATGPSTDDLELDFPAPALDQAGSTAR